VTVDMAAGRVTGAAQGTLVSFRDVSGSDYADTILGDAAGNGLWGGLGDDV
jgi:hypothetical protein